MHTVLVAAAVLVACAAAFPQQPADPIIGIFTAPMVGDCPPPPAAGQPFVGCVHSIYPDWLKGAGVRAIAVPWNSTDTEMEWLLSRVNGVFFMGGGLDFTDAMDHYFAQVQKVVKKGLKWNAEGDEFLMWGTCEGFQVMAAAVAGSLDIIRGKYLGMYPLMMPLQFTAAQPASRMFGADRMDAHLKHIFTAENSTVNWHHLIVPASLFDTPAIAAVLTPLSTNLVPNNGTQFISAYEGKTANMYGVQFHPERPPIDFTNDAVGHTVGDITASQYMANFLASRLKLNKHSFDTPQQGEALMLAHYPMGDSGWGLQTYFITEKPPQ
jgi:gamma-glutamyl hydrolase